ncbi:hypothetical protein [Paraburkholderia pallida]|uniref:hypothetical protein n=1 Tax=Paraburkholderia pallida TaxID=2547399 RepID=UPI0014322CFE
MLRLHGLDQQNPAFVRRTCCRAARRTIRSPTLKIEYEGGRVDDLLAGSMRMVVPDELVAYFRDPHVLIVDLRDDIRPSVFRHTAERGFVAERLGKRRDRHGYFQVGMTDTASSTPIARLKMRQ